MLNEKENIGLILKDITKSAEGRSCLVACVISIVMATLNWSIPDLFGTTNLNRTEKWLVIWLIFPLLNFLLYLRVKQLFDGAGILWTLVRSVFVLLPVFVLIYFNI